MLQAYKSIQYIYPCLMQADTNWGFPPEVFCTVIVNENPVYTVRRSLMENEGACVRACLCVPWRCGLIFSLIFCELCWFGLCSSNYFILWWSSMLLWESIQWTSLKSLCVDWCVRVQSLQIYSLVVLFAKNKKKNKKTHISENLICFYSFQPRLCLIVNATIK